MLLAAGAVPDKIDPREKAPPVHLASLNGHADVVRLLVHAGAPVDKRASGGLTALHCAAGMGHTNVVRVLVSANATVDVKASGVVNWCNCRRDASVVCDTLL